MARKRIWPPKKWVIKETVQKAFITKTKGYYTNTNTYIHFIPPISATRVRLADEITPSSVEHSRTYNNNEETNGAARVIDLDLVTRSRTSAVSGSKSWFKINLNQVHCVQQLIRYQTDGNHRFTWTCSQAGCVCEGESCDKYRLTISAEGTVPNNPTTDCQYGDTVLLDKINSGWFYVYEIAVTGRQGK